MEELGCELWHVILVDKCSTKLSGMKVTNTHKPLDVHKSDLLFVVKDAIFKLCTHAHTKSRSQAKYHAHWSGNDTSAQGK